MPHLAAVCAVLCLAVSCSTTKHVPDGQYLLNDVRLTVDDRSDVDTRELYSFLRQTPNHKVLGFARLQLSTYSLSGRDSTKWYNRWLRRLGQPPVIYDSALTEASGRQLQLALINKGYLDATVVADTIVKGRKRMDVNYRITAGEPRRISAINYQVEDPVVARLVLSDTSSSAIKSGMLLDRNILDAERQRITRQLRNSGYYDFNREFINYLADTVAGSRDTELTLRVYSLDSRKGRSNTASVSDTLGLSGDKHHRFRVDRVTYIIEYDGKSSGADTVVYKGIRMIYPSKSHLIKPSVLDEMCYIQPGSLYSASNVERTYEALGRLSIIKYINVEMTPSGADGDTGLLDAVIKLSRNKKQAVSMELEGTNSEGDFGFGVGLTYQHRNLAHGSEMLTAKVRGSYESLSGNLDGLINNCYTEFAAEVGITIPKFECPFMSKSFKQRRLATTEFTFSTNYQERPEYTRVIFGTAWKWKWQQRSEYLKRHTFDLIDINYVRLPRTTIDFIDQISPDNPLLRYSYEDHFIMRLGYTLNLTNRRPPSADVNALAVQPSVTSLRVSGEMAGNLLYGISNIIGQKKSDGVYKVLGIQYAQYIKGEADYTYTYNFNSRNSLALHGGFGIAYPYGNSSMVPFEKRFYAGGANGVRGWGVRTLGPGSYDARNSMTNFINQCGDIRLELSVEYRAKLFWVLEGALFIDAGNVWTIKDYETQPGGLFRFNKFYKQIALAYGAGIRLDFTYFLLRFDLGVKAHNPAQNQEPWPILHPRWKRDTNFHFSVGYPF